MLGTGGTRWVGTRRRVPLPHWPSLLLLIIFLLLSGVCHGHATSDDHQVKVNMMVGKCIETERKALLAVRADIRGADHDWLSSWETVDDCCRWEGVGCDNHTGHVVMLHLQYPGPADGSASKINPSLLNLTGLRYLDLSHNNFSGASIPSFVGSLVHLEYLDLSYAQFAGSVPPELGSLRNLQSLDLSSESYTLQVENLGWLSHLSHLQHLDMSSVDLSAVSDWLHVINMLPSLSVLRLRSCGLRNLLTGTLPHVNFSSLSTLDLSWNSFNATWPLWLCNVSSLMNLDLGHNEIEGTIPGSLWTLDKLKKLDLSGHNLRIRLLPEHMGNVSNLQELYLRGVIGRLPDSLASLQHLEIRGSTIELPRSIGNLRHLEFLGLYFNSITGGIPESLGNLTHLKSLELSHSNISGGLPKSLGWRNIGGLCNLTQLTVQENNIGDGVEVTELLERLSQCTGGSGLEDLDLHDNGFSGHLPDQVGQLYNLRSLRLRGNSIVGSIPASIGDLKSLTTLDLSHNKLSGLVPTSIGNLSNLSALELSSNSLVGVLSEAHFTNLSTLGSLDMSYNAALSLNVSGAWVPPFQLSYFYMRACHVGPEFPHWLQTQPTLSELDLSDNVIQDSLADNFFNSFPSMRTLNLSHNGVKGVLPLSFSSAPFINLDLSFNDFEASQLHLHSGSSLNILDLSNNLLSGPIFVDTSELMLNFLDLSHNKLNGSIPLPICKMKNLQVLDLSDNHLSGTIPRCWENTLLVIMKLSNNKLLGPIPSSLGSLLYLASLHLDKNNFTGEIPSSFNSSINLVTLDLGENKLSGEIPAWLGESLSLLQVLRLRSNMFHGSIPKSMSQLQSLRILDLACNRLSGSLLLSFQNLSAMVKVERVFESLLPPILSVRRPSTFEESITIVPKGTQLEYTKTLSLVTIIDLSGNNFSGYIPEEITCLKGLRFLNLSRNHLEGKIPTNVSTMTILEALDLSFNQLIGKIPSSISGMYFLSRFNVSYNNLLGRIPSGSQLQTFDQSAYIGNAGLCGSPLLRPCPDDPTSHDPIFQASEEPEHKHEPYIIWFYIGMGTGFAAGFWGFLGLLLLMKNKRILYFRFIDYVADGLYVMVVVHIARLKSKISTWMQPKST